MDPSTFEYSNESHLSQMVLVRSNELLIELLQSLKYNRQQITDTFVHDVILALNDQYKEVSLSHDSSLKKANARSSSVLGQVKPSFETLYWCTKSISLAEHPSRELFVAYGKRALIQFQSSLFDQYLADARRAMQSGNGVISLNSERLIKRLLDNFYKKYHSTIMKSFQRQVNLLRPSDDDPRKIAGVRRTELFTFYTETEDREREWRDMCRLDNRYIQNASSKIRLRYDHSKREQFVEVTEDLKAGEVIAVQEFFAAYLRRGLEHSRCSLCFALCSDLIPCPTCNVMMYCSKRCRGYAYELYHRLECKILSQVDFFEYDDLGGTQFRVVRLLLIGTEQGFKLAKLMQKMTLSDLLDPDCSLNEILKDEYETALGFSKTYSHYDVAKHVPSIANMIKILQFVGFFDPSDRSLPYDPEYQDGSMTKAQVFTSFLLLNHILRMDERLVDVTIIREKFAPTHNDGKIAEGFCTFFAVLSHSCDANVFIMPRNLQAAFITRRPIAKGEKITISYAQVIGEKCECDACTDGRCSPEYLQYTLQFPYHFTHIPETACSELRTLLRPVANLEKFMSLSPKEILQVVLGACDWLYTNIQGYFTIHHFEIQRLVLLFMQFFYGTFNEHIPLKAVIKEGYHSLIWLKIMDYINMDLETT